MKDLKEMTLPSLTEELLELGEPKYRAKQIHDWIHVHHVRSFDEMTNLPKSLREKLASEYDLTVLKIVKRLDSSQDETSKYLLETGDGNLIEAVFMKYRYGNSVCISSQAGCRMGCRFCASAKGGLIRNLTPSEMLDEVYAISRDKKERISHVVVMGTGEPFDNFETLCTFIGLISDEEGMNLSKRNITVSTCGIAPKIREFADLDLPVTLALSLHASNNEKRKELMPVARTYDLEEVLSACAYYHETTGRRVSLEYALIAGVNDREEDLRELSALARKNGFHVNLIPVNPVEGTGFSKPDRKAALAFQNKLEKYGVNVTMRRTLGADIAGACGQLRSQSL